MNRIDFDSNLVIVQPGCLTGVDGAPFQSDYASLGRRLTLARMNTIRPPMVRLEFIGLP